MTCQDAIGFLLDYLEQRLPPTQQAVFEQHLAQCPSCANYLSSYQATISLGRDALSDDEAHMPDELLQGILATLGQDRPLPNQA